MSRSEPSAAARPARRRRRWRRPLLDVASRLAPPVLGAALRLLTLTWRVTFEGAEELFERWDRGERVIVAFWHDRLLMMAPAARGRGVCILVSEHRDGEIASRILPRWDVRVVRGSASRGGVGGFLRLVDAYRGGSSLAVLPDGPRGPRHVVKRGVIHLAKATGAMIFPLAAAARPRARLGSWDRLIVPLPFARIRLLAGSPLVVPRKATAEEIEVARRTLEERLTDVAARVEARVAG